MTTIAWDGKTLSGDKQTTFGRTAVPNTKVVKCYPCDEHGQRLDRHKEIKRLPDYLVGYSGTGYQRDDCLNWAKSGFIDKKKPKFDDEENEAWLIRVSRYKKWGDLNWYYQIEVCNKYFNWEIINSDKWAMGSGGDYALGAMYAGKTSAEAVEIACKLDINSGLGIDTIGFE